MYDKIFNVVIVLVNNLYLFISFIVDLVVCHFL